MPRSVVSEALHGGLSTVNTVQILHSVGLPFTPPSHNSGSGVPVWVSLLVGVFVLVGIVVTLMLGAKTLSKAAVWVRVCPVLGTPDGKPRAAGNRDERRANLPCSVGDGELATFPAVGCDPPSPTAGNVAS